MFYFILDTFEDKSTKCYLGVKEKEEVCSHTINVNANCLWSPEHYSELAEEGSF